MTSDESIEQPPGEPELTATESPVIEVRKAAHVPLSRMPRTFFNRRWWWVTLLVLVLMAVFARLGIWQLGRLEERKQSNALYLAQLSQSPLLLNGADLPAGAEELVDRSAIARGHYDHAQQIAVTQQSWLGRPGAHLVTPLVMDDGQTAVLVDRGWIPAVELENADLAQFDEPGPQVVNGAIQLSQTLSGGRQTQVDGPQQQWYRIDVEAIQEQMPYQLLPFYLLQTPPEGVQDILPYRVALEVDISEGPHLGYAIQWFLFAAVLGVGYTRFVSTHDERSEAGE